MASRGHGNREVLGTRLRKLRLCSHYRAFSHDVTTAILVFQNNEMAVIRSLTVITINASCLINDTPQPPPQGFHSRGQHLCKFTGTKESVCVRREVNSKGTALEHQHGHRFIVLDWPIWPLWLHVKTLYAGLAFCADTRSYINIRFCVNTYPICDSTVEMARRSFNRAEITVLIRFAHKSSFWARSATVSAKRDRTSAERRAPSAKRERASERKFMPGPTTPDQTRKPCERLWESLLSYVWIEAIRYGVNMWPQLFC